jgi:hypothetical protein
MEDPGENNAFGDANQNELFASLVNYDELSNDPSPWFIEQINCLIQC